MYFEVYDDFLKGGEKLLCSSIVWKSILTSSLSTSLYVLLSIFNLVGTFTICANSVSVAIAFLIYLPIYSVGYNGTAPNPREAGAGRPLY